MGIGSFVSNTLGSITGANDAAAAAIEGARLSAAEREKAKVENLDLQEWLWGEQKALYQPYAEMGAGAIPQYQEALASPINLKEDPGYQFGLSQGVEALGSSGAARGMQLSGAQAKGITRYGQDYASTKYGEAVQRRQMNLDNLYRMILGGQSAVAGQAAAGSQYGAEASRSILGGGEAQAQMYSDIGNIKAGQAMSGFNTLMDIGQLAATAYGGMGGGGAVSGNPMAPVSSNINIGFSPTSFR